MNIQAVMSKELPIRENVLLGALHALRSYEKGGDCLAKLSADILENEINEARRKQYTLEQNETAQSIAHNPNTEPSEDLG